MTCPHRIFLLLKICYLNSKIKLKKSNFKTAVFLEVIRNKKKTKRSVNLNHPERFIFGIVKPTHTGYAKYFHTENVSMADFFSVLGNINLFHEHFLTHVYIIVF